MSFRDTERRRAYNRSYHRRPAPDGRCEATTRKGRRCPFAGRYDGLHAQVLCDLHSRGTP